MLSGPYNVKLSLGETMNFKAFLEQEQKQEYFKKLVKTINEDSQSHEIFPPFCDVFKAFELTDFDSTRVVIIGQDPYHGPNQAMGLSFSVNQGVALPPSLRNIFKELESDLGIKNTNGSLVNWAKQGVLLLNTTLTVRSGLPMSHQNKGWEIFTRRWIELLNENKEGLIFVLWGRHAQQFEAILDTTKHHILKSPHPSPLSASRGFLGSRVFSRINSLLEQPIDWRTD